MGADVQITYDLLSELDDSRISKQGAAILRRHFPVGESGPLIVLAHKPGSDLDSPAGKRATLELTRMLYVDGVQSVRSIAAPMGKRPEAAQKYFRLSISKSSADTSGLSQQRTFTRRRMWHEWN